MVIFCGIARIKLDYARRVVGCLHEQMNYILGVFTAGEASLKLCDNPQKVPAHILKARKQQFRELKPLSLEEARTVCLGGALSLPGGSDRTAMLWSQPQHFLGSLEQGSSLSGHQFSQISELPLRNYCSAS